MKQTNRRGESPSARREPIQLGSWNREFTPSSHRGLDVVDQNYTKLQNALHCADTRRGKILSSGFLRRKGCFSGGPWGERTVASVVDRSSDTIHKRRVSSFS